MQLVFWFMISNVTSDLSWKHLCVCASIGLCGHFGYLRRFVTRMIKPCSDGWKNITLQTTRPTWERLHSLFGPETCSRRFRKPFNDKALIGRMKKKPNFIKLLVRPDNDLIPNWPLYTHFNNKLCLLFIYLFIYLLLFFIRLFSSQFRSCSRWISQIRKLLFVFSIRF